MARWTWWTCMALWGLTAVAAERWTAELRQGERCSGELLALDADDLQLVLAGPPAATRTIPRPALARLWHDAPWQPPPAATMAVELANGDRLAPSRLALADGTFELELPAGQRLRVSREWVRAVQAITDNGASRVRGLGRLADWDGHPENWEAVGSAFRVRAVPAVLTRREVLAERSRIALVITAEPPPDLWLYLFVKADGQRPGAGYALHVAGHDVSLERHADTGVATPVGTCRLAGQTAPGTAIEIGLAIDLIHGRFCLTNADGLAGDWTDPAGWTPPGTDLVLDAGPAAAEVRHLAVSCLPANQAFTVDLGPAAGTDRICLQNGDAVEGELETVAAGFWTLRRGADTRPLRLQNDAVRLVWLRRPTTAGLSQPMGLTRVILRDGSEFGASALAVSAGRLQVSSPAWTNAEFDVDSVAEIRFGAP